MGDGLIFLIDCTFFLKKIKMIAHIINIYINLLHWFNATGNIYSLLFYVAEFVSINFGQITTSI